MIFLKKTSRTNPKHMESVVIERIQVIDLNLSILYLKAIDYNEKL
jgi:hypothetical protein